MKLYITISLILFLKMNLFAQIQVDNIQNNLYQVNENYIKTYRIFPTINISYFIKLNTRTGQMWQIKFDRRKTNQLEIPLSNLSLVENQEEQDNRFALYSTQDSWKFLLLDQVSGKIWQVDWGMKPDKNKISAVNNSYLVEKQTKIENRFQLYPTRDSRFFLLLNEINGKLWQINWSSKPEESEIIAIQ